MDTVSKVVIATAISMVGLIVYAGYTASQSNAEYQTVCKLNGGTPAHNGRHWECLGANK